MHMCNWAVKTNHHNIYLRDKLLMCIQKELFMIERKWSTYPRTWPFLWKTTMPS
jgi:hypothetical protein